MMVCSTPMIHGMINVQWFYEFNLNHRRYVLNRGKECGQGGQESGTRSSQPEMRGRPGSFS